MPDKPPFDPATAPDWEPLHDPWFDTEEGEQWRREHGGDKPGIGAGSDPGGD